MAKAVNNILLNGVSGKQGGIVIRQMRDGSVRLSAPPDFSNRQFSITQKEHQKRFKQAAAYARRAAQMEPVYAELAERTMRNAYNIALSDWFNPPVIHEIRRSDHKILVEASDNVRVAKVRVTILDGQGLVLEAGAAAPREGNWWEYVPNNSGRTIAAEAWDLAGNVTKFGTEL